MSIYTLHNNESLLIDKHNLAKYNAHYRVRPIFLKFFFTVAITDTKESLEEEKDVTKIRKVIESWSNRHNEAQESNCNAAYG